MSSVNKVIIVGRLGKDPETKYMPNGKAIASFSLATSENWKDKSGEKQEKTEWHNCTAFDKLAEIVSEYVKKGSLLYVEGKLQTDKYEKDGATRYSTKIIVQNLTMLGGKQDSNNKDSSNNEHSVNQDNSDKDIPF